MICGRKLISRRQTLLEDSATLHQYQPSAMEATPVSDAAMSNLAQLCVAQARSAQRKKLSQDLFFQCSLPRELSQEQVPVTRMTDMDINDQRSEKLLRTSMLRPSLSYQEQESRSVSGVKKPEGILK